MGRPSFEPRNRVNTKLFRGGRKCQCKESLSERERERERETETEKETERERDGERETERARSVGCEGLQEAHLADD